MTSMPATSPNCDESAEPERIPLAHGLTALIYRYSDGEPRRRRKLLPPDRVSEVARQEAFLAWQVERASHNHAGPSDDGGAA